MTETNRDERCPSLINFQKQVIQGLRPSTSVITKRVTLAAERCESATDDQQTVFTLRPRGIRFDSIPSCDSDGHIQKFSIQPQRQYSMVLPCCVGKTVF